MKIDMNSLKDIKYVSFALKALKLKSTYKELGLLLKVCSHGITVVEL